jgi:hypothetical protein
MCGSNVLVETQRPQIFVDMGGSTVLVEYIETSYLREHGRIYCHTHEWKESTEALNNS